MLGMGWGNSKVFLHSTTARVKQQTQTTTNSVTLEENNNTGRGTITEVSAI